MSKIFYILAGIGITVLVVTSSTAGPGTTSINEITTNNSTRSNACGETLEYSIGDFDDRFGIDREQLLEVLAEAESVWEDEFDRELFSHNPDADFTIDMSYGELQQDTEVSAEIESELEETESTLESLRQVYDSLVDEHKERLARYESMADSLSRDYKEYNAKVQRWNNKGGAPPAVHRELEEERIELERREQELEGLRTELNNLQQRINRLAEENEGIVDEYNTNVLTYNQLFDDQQRFNKGEHQGNTITVYQFYNKKDLRLVLAHEFGHALGIEHVKNSKSIMYHLMGEQNINDPDLTQEDVEAFREKCDA